MPSAGRWRLYPRRNPERRHDEKVREIQHESIKLHPAHSGGFVAGHNIAVECLRAWRGKEHFFFRHTPNPDIYGHRYGVKSPEYREALVSNDHTLGILLEAIEPETQVVVATDHGFVQGAACSGGQTHDQCPDIWLVAAPPLLLNGTRLLDVAPAIRP